MNIRHEGKTSNWLPGDLSNSTPGERKRTRYITIHSTRVNYAIKGIAHLPITIAWINGKLI